MIYQGCLSADITHHHHHGDDVCMTTTDHWREQIDRHVEKWALTNSSDGSSMCWIEPCDGSYGKTPLPTPWEISRRLVMMITTRERLAHEWIRGKPSCALEVRSYVMHLLLLSSSSNLFLMTYPSSSSLNSLVVVVVVVVYQDRIPDRYADEYYGCGGKSSRRGGESVSSLLQVKWLRVVVDEGHSLGSVAITQGGKEEENGSAAAAINTTDTVATTTTAAIIHVLMCCCCSFCYCCHLEST